MLTKVFPFLNGLGVTGMNSPVVWCIYVTNFAFFIGISYAGALLSEILRLTNAEWRRPLTRLAEAITVFSLPIGALSIVFDMGRPDRLLNLGLFPRFSSPILWDVTAITVYLVSSILFLYAMVPDIALARQRFPSATGLRRWFYAAFAKGYTGTQEQNSRLGRIVRGLAIWVTVLAVAPEFLRSNVAQATIAYHPYPTAYHTSADQRSILPDKRRPWGLTPLQIICYNLVPAL